MSLGKVIRKYRKLKNMTQEEMAGRLGVTAPAVNKWENENSYPDIMLLAPIARLLDISLDTLLSFQKDLTREEIEGIIYEMEAKLKEEPYEEVFGWARKKAEQYPNCESLLLQLAVILDAHRIVQDLSNGEDYEEYLCSLYVRVLESSDESLRVRAADALVSFYRRKKQYEKAEEYLQYYSIQNPERKYKQAQIYSETDRMEEAYQAYEELLFADYQRASADFTGMYLLAMKEHDLERAHMLADRQADLARCFDMGRYYEISPRLELAIWEKDADTTIAIMEEMLACVESIGDFRKSPLYEHIKMKEIREEFLAEIKDNLRKGFREDESCGFLKGNKKWEELTKE